MISYIERTYFNDLLNRGGYVLDFSTYRFDEFTLHSVCLLYTSPSPRDRG